jgi:hypothetical protein
MTMVRWSAIGAAAAAAAACVACRSWLSVRRTPLAAVAGSVHFVCLQRNVGPRPQSGTSVPTGGRAVRCGAERHDSVRSPPRGKKAVASGAVPGSLGRGPTRNRRQEPPRERTQQDRRMVPSVPMNWN